MKITDFKFTLLALLFILCALLARAQKNEIQLFGTGHFTEPSLGEFSNTSVIRQFSRTSAGAGAEYVRWWRNNGMQTSYSWTPTDSKLESLSKQTLVIWPIQRSEVTLMYQHRFMNKKKVNPYVGVGGMGTILWGGACPHHTDTCSGLDGQWGVAVKGAVGYQLTKQLEVQTGFQAESVKASTFGDPSYSSSLTAMIEPRLGISYRFSKGLSPK